MSQSPDPVSPTTIGSQALDTKKGRTGDTRGWQARAYLQGAPALAGPWSEPSHC